MATGLAVLAWAPLGASRLKDPDRSGSVETEVAAKRRRKILAASATGSAVSFAFNSLGWLSLVLGAAAGAASYLILGRLVSGPQQQRRARIAAELPRACDLMVVCLEAGLPVRAAAEAVARALTGPLAAALTETTAKVRLGIDEHRAWAEFAEDPALLKLGRELSRGTSSGLSLTTRLRALGVDARREAEAAAETQAKKVGVRSVLPLMVCFLPAFVLLSVVPIIGGMVLRLFG